MLQNKKMIQLIISAVMALLFINFYLKQKEQALENAYGIVEVLVAARDIPPRTLLAPDYLTTQKVPIRFMQPGAYMVKIPTETLGRVRNKVTVAAVPAGSQIVQTNLMDPSIKDTGVAPLLPPGKRGYLLRLGNTDVGDLLLPGDHIDIMATFTVKGNNGGNSKATYTILQNILVISVGRVLKKMNEDSTGKKEGTEALMLTLALDPGESEKMALAQAESQGDIHIVVRPHGETDVRPVPGVSGQSFSQNSR